MRGPRALSLQPSAEIHAEDCQPSAEVHKNQGQHANSTVDVCWSEQRHRQQLLPRQHPQLQRQQLLPRQHPLQRQQHQPLLHYGVIS